MFAVLIVSLAVAGAIAFFLSRSGHALWRSIVGVIAGLPVGFLCGAFAGLGWTVKVSSAESLRILIASLIWALFGAVGGAIYGWKKRKAAQTSDLKH